MRLLPFLLWFAACAPKRAAPVKAPQSMDAAVASVLTGMESGSVSSIPDSLDGRITKVLEARNLTPKAVDATRAKAFQTRRTTQHRLVWLADNAGGAPLLVLVEAEVEYYSQLSGRYRWTVRVTASVADADAPGEPVSSEFNVPVFLQYHHEKEPEALEAAAPVIERNLGFLLDEYLGGLEG